MVKADPASALDNILRQLDRARLAGMRTLEGHDARPQLAMLEAEIARQKELLDHGNAIDPAWLRETIRWVATWAPETDLTLLGALGLLARAISPHETR